MSNEQRKRRQSKETATHIEKQQQTKWNNKKKKILCNRAKGITVIFNRIFNCSIFNNNPSNFYPAHTRNRTNGLKLVFDVVVVDYGHWNRIVCVPFGSTNWMPNVVSCKITHPQKGSGWKVHFSLWPNTRIRPSTP